MKYQSIIIKSNSSEIGQIKTILKEELNITQEIQEVNINVISKPSEKESIGIGEVNELVQWAYRKNDQLRLLILEKAEILTDQAQNSLLKLIEEPPENILIVLVTANPNQILPTILSRCMVIKGVDVDSIKFDKKVIVNFINANYLERSRIIDKMISDDMKRNSAGEFIEEILKLKLENKDVKNIEEIENVYRGIKRGVNLKLCFDYLNTLLE